MRILRALPRFGAVRHLRSSRRFGAGSRAALSLLLLKATARAQTPPPAAELALGEWTLRPSVELRTRGEYRYHPIDTGGAAPTRSGPPLVFLPADNPVTHQGWIHERARMGLLVEREALSALVVVQDARLWGSPSPVGLDPLGGLGATLVHQAYFEVHTSDVSLARLRVGRQEIAWGAGRLLGTSDWSPVARALDAVQGHLALGPLDVEGLAALLSTPGALPPTFAPTESTGTGAQLYGVDATLHGWPLLQAELTGLVRIVRPPLAALQQPAGTYVGSLRLFGDRTGIAYDAEVAYELGRMGVVGGERSLAALAAAGQVTWQTTAPWQLQFGASASYASGDDGQPTGTSHRFDPLLPDVRNGLGRMGLYSWSNVIAGAGTISATPADTLTVVADYRYLRLANPRGAWYSAELFPVAQDPSNDAAGLGHEIDAQIDYTPWPALRVTAGYGVFVTQAGARALLASAGRGGPALVHAAYLQASVAAP